MVADSLGTAICGSLPEVLVGENHPESFFTCEGNFEFSAQATAVALDAGAGANADYDKGVAIFTLGERGLMAEASVGGQKFNYVPY